MQGMSELNSEKLTPLYMLKVTKEWGRWGETIYWRIYEHYAMDIYLIPLDNWHHKKFKTREVNFYNMHNTVAN